MTVVILFLLFSTRRLLGVGKSVAWHGMAAVWRTFDHAPDPKLSQRIQNLRLRCARARVSRASRDPARSGPLENWKWQRTGKLVIKRSPIKCKSDDPHMIHNQSFRATVVVDPGDRCCCFCSSCLLFYIPCLLVHVRVWI